VNVQETANALLDKLTAWLQDLVLLLPNFVVAVLTVLGFALVARIVRRVVTAGLGKFSSHKSINRLLGTIAHLAVIIVGLFIALGIVGLDKTVTSLLAGVGIIGLALGFAFQEIASNFMSGIILLLRRPFHHDNIVESNGHIGVIREVNLRATVMHTMTGQIVHIPNNEVLNNPIVNYSTGRRRVDLSVGVSYGDDLEKARRVAVKAVEGVESRDMERDVELFYEGFGSSSIDFVVRFWIPFQRWPDFLAARSDAVMRIKSAFDENDITIPFPIRTLDFGIVGGERLTEVLETTGLARSSTGNGR
jgi:small conductance mechanosensitive channel